MRIVCFLTVLLFVNAARAAAPWIATEWQGESAYAATETSWKAVVSVSRGRLVYLGPADGSANLLFSTPGKSHPAGWGGHRLWLGPQVEWSSTGWPPPTAWEKSAALQTRLDGERLVLVMPESGDGWPQITREYEWKSGQLLCNARIHGGTRSAQIIHILQVPSQAFVTLRASDETHAPLGYALLHLGRKPSPQIQFSPRPQVTRDGGALRIAFNGTAEKIGTDSQPLQAVIGRYRLTVSRTAPAGLTAVVPDDGFVTQVYLGRQSEPVVELEQLSALSEPGRDASFGVVVQMELATTRR